MVTLDSLSVEDACYLLDYRKLNAITNVARENQFSGILSIRFVATIADYFLLDSNCVRHHSRHWSGKCR